MKATLTEQINIQKAKAKNIPYLFALYEQEIGTSWTEKDFLSFTKIKTNDLYEISFGSQCVGFVMVSRIKPEANLLNIVVSKPLQHMGIGRQAMQQLVVQLKKQEIQTLFLEVRENSPAEEFYKGNGFVRTGMRKAYYPDGQNAILMQRSI